MRPFSLNCTLQKDQLNRGEWQLETQIREWADELGTLNIEIILDFNTTATVLPTGATIPVDIGKTFASLMKQVAVLFSQ